MNLAWPTPHYPLYIQKPVAFSVRHFGWLLLTHNILTALSNFVVSIERNRGRQKMDKFYGLGHLFVMVFLHNFSAFMVVPAITDVTMAALCPGQDECSLAIYLTGFQQAVSESYIRQ